MVKRRANLGIGDRINLIRIRSGNDSNYASQVLDIITEDIFVVSGPIYKSKIILIQKNEIVRVSYIIEDKGRYYFNAKVLDREYETIYKLKLQKISDIKRLQLRRYYRFPVDIPVVKEFTIKKNDTEKIITEKCRTKDISGGGLKLYSNYRHGIGDTVLCKFNISDHEITVNGKILRIEKVDTFEYEYGLGIEFEEISENDRDKIIQFIFFKQLLLRGKGLI